MTGLRFEPAAEPEVSVLLVTYGAWEWTERALTAIRDTTEVPHEVICVDNASPDGSADRLAAIDGLRLIRGRRNHGFGAAANLAAMAARAPRLLLLNTDALVQPGWLPPLLEVLDGEDDVAAVSGRLLHLDRSLQEAGSILWGDGASDNYGDGDDPERQEYRFRRNVDFASAACLLVRADAFRDSGGFDPAYHPAYYEDTELAMRWRERGLRVVYQPRSTALHKRWASSGDRAAMTPTLLRNRGVFLDRWRHLVGARPARPEPLDPLALLAVRDAECAERLLVVVGGLEGVEDAPARDLLAGLARLVPHWRVTALCVSSSGEGEAAEVARSGGVEVIGGVEPAAWLAGRRRHYTAVAAAVTVPDVLEEAIGATQPVILRLDGLGDLPEEELARRLQRAGLLLLRAVSPLGAAGGPGARPGAAAAAASPPAPAPAAPGGS